LKQPMTAPPKAAAKTSGKLRELALDVATAPAKPPVTERAGYQAERPFSLRSRIYDIVRKRILTGELAPGATIDEKAIAAEFGVSRMPVREAIKKLTDEHLVEVKAQSRTLVKPIDRKLIHEAFLIRRALELESIGQAADRISTADLHRLEDVHMLHTLALQRRRFVEAIGLDDSFHRLISEISDLPRLWQAIEVSKAHLDRCRYLTVPRPGLADATLAQHRLIIDALTERDAASARRAMADHLEKAYSGILMFLDHGGPGLANPQSSN
jgi:GntR family transcriptional regulator, rspAB operon transcriptional repressor